MSESWRKKIGGQAHWTEADGQAAVAAWRSSGESLTSFARRHNMHPQRLSWWRERLGRSSESSLVPVTVRGEVTVGGVAATVTIGEVRIEVLDVGQVPASWLATIAVALRETVS